MLNLKQGNEKWFTLVELIVVIVILSILATIAFLSFSSQSWSARDSTRLSDISSIKKWMEMYNVWSWLYPTPDKPTSFTYSWGTIWNQWTLWDTAYKLIQKTLSKKVKDPLKDSEYDYSLASNKREYQVAWNFENPTSLQRNYNPFQSSTLNPQLSALWWTWTNVYISWNYNWVLLKVFTWSTYYFVPTPTLFWLNANWTWNVIYDNTFWSWKDILPWINNVAIFDSSKVYSTWSDNLWSTDITNLMNTVKAAYSTWNVTTPAVQAIVNASWAELVNIWNWLVKNSLWGAGQSNLQSTTNWCLNQPNYNNANFVIWLPVQTNQIWQNTSSWNACYFSCINWTIWNWSNNCIADSSNTVLLLHFENNLVNAWTNTWEVFNNWMSFTWWKFWKSWDFDWINDYINIPDSNDWSFWTWDFTIDTWFNLKALSNDNANQMFFIQRIDGFNAIALYYLNESTSWWHQIRWVWYGSYPTNMVELFRVTSVNINEWKHLAFIRNSWSNSLYLNWVKMWASITNANSMPNLTGNLEIWRHPIYTSFLNGMLDEFRIVKWKAVWTSNFTPPTSPY
ncbi:MAG: hypothetical protein ACD_3C00037G0034 [uncultured bacterium (gcode 4)]|uniref:Uncharacterized protein n=1 Tax=uncultured bacterium (gcode 4) TaxID=1234023 RepID=K2G0D2_9BACT|nr:MAG: hypothetical protein ACD_3C00037G0034 [uncultured bacterium (gcode 4)]